MTTICFTLREKCSSLEFFWFVFSRIWTEYGKILLISPYSVQMRENTDQKNSEYRHFSRSVTNHQKRKLVDFLKKYSCIIYVKISLECKFEKVYTQTEPKLSALTLKLSKASMSLSKDDSYKKYIFRKIYDKKCFRSVNFYSYATHYVYVKSSQHNKLV